MGGDADLLEGRRKTLISAGLMFGFDRPEGLFQPKRLRGSWAVGFQRDTHENLENISPLENSTN